ncbi:MAG: type II toxin-antitoxin system VapC family toxin [Ktedonobacteraceae bacterium]
MGWLEDLRGKVVGLDTVPIIYYLDGYQDFRETLHPFFAMVNNKECSVVTSVISLLEGLVKPISQNDEDWARKYYKFLYSTDGVKTYEVSPNIAERAARLRAFNNIKAPDAIQVATAIHAKASVFLTNDVKLASIPDIQVLVLKHLKTDS